MRPAPPGRRGCPHPGAGAGPDGENGAVAATPAVGVLIVDDQAPFRRAARAVVTATPGFEVVGEAETRRGGGRAGRRARARPRADGHQPARHQRHRGDPPDHRRAPRRRRACCSPPTRPPTSPPDADACGAAAYVHKEEFGPAVVRDVWAPASAGPVDRRIGAPRQRQPSSGMRPLMRGARARAPTPR